MNRRNRGDNVRYRIAASLLIMGLTITGCSAGMGNSAQKKIDQKMDVIDSYVDRYFLNEVDDNNVEQYIYKGMMAGLDDPYSEYYTEEEYDQMMESTEGEYYGIGVMVSQNPSTKIITVVKAFENGPSYEAGIQPGDVLYQVNGEDCGATDVSTVVSKIKGKEGTTVDLTLLREGESEPVKITVERRKIEVPTVAYHMMEDNIGYIEVTEFDKVTSGQFIDAVDRLENQGMKGLVIDLRNNTGGLVDATVKMLDRLLPKGLYVYTEDKNGKRNEYEGTTDQKLTVPMAVLINANSASASELFAGAVRDYEAGTLVGTTSFGKGIVQQIFPLGDGSAVKLTTAKYYTPKGQNIHGIGIEPDVQIDLPEKLKTQPVLTEQEDVQLQKAVKVVKQKLK